MITEDYVNADIVKLLEEKGFPIKEVQTWYCEFDGYPDKNIINDRQYPIITLQMAMKWLREVHKLHIAILLDCGAYTGKNSFYYHIDRMDNYEYKGYNKIGLDSYEQTCQVAIKDCLENLI